MGPYRSGGVVFEVSGQFAYVGHFDGALAVLAASCLYRSNHQPDFVGFVAVAGHTEEGDLLSVRAPDRIGVITAIHRDTDGLAGYDLVDIYFRISRERIFTAGVHFLAGICDAHAVRTPAELLCSAERLQRQFVSAFVLSQDIERVVFRDALGSAWQGSDESLGLLCRPVVPVPVHEVFGDICLGLVQLLVEILGSLHGSLYCPGVQHLGLVGTDRELSDSVPDVTQLGGSAEAALAACEGDAGFEQLSSLKIVDRFAVIAPPGVIDALAFLGELDLLSEGQGSILVGYHFGQEEIPA